MTEVNLNKCNSQEEADELLTEYMVNLYPITDLPEEDQAFAGRMWTVALEERREADQAAANKLAYKNASCHELPTVTDGESEDK